MKATLKAKWDIVNGLLVVKKGEGLIGLQAHDDDSKPISFRNIWIRELR
jgi:hypothetical protein